MAKKLSSEQWKELNDYRATLPKAGFVRPPEMVDAIKAAHYIYAQRLAAIAAGNQDRWAAIQRESGKRRVFLEREFIREQVIKNPPVPQTVEDGEG